MSKTNLKSIPSVDSLIQHPKIKSLKDIYTGDFISYSIRTILNEVRTKTKKGNTVPPVYEIISEIERFILSISEINLKKVVNATGIVLHTNLGRAPLGEKIFNEIKSAITGYSNLEFDLGSGKRGKRTDHILELLKYFTKAESAVIVNNNAAALSIVLRTFSEGKETIVSRGELIEIGGSFRLPEIIAASGTKMIEVGTTNRTRVPDYENAINKNTGVILKAHKSNYTIEGFSEEVRIKELSALLKKKKILLVHDIGSGLLTDTTKGIFDQEPTIKKSFAEGADIVTFSCDKLLGGPQAGIIAGKKNLIDKISKHPLMRTYRVDKLTIALLSAALRSYIMNDGRIDLPIYNMFYRTREELKSLAGKLCAEFKKQKIESEVRESEAFSGGGSMPNVKLSSYSVVLNLPGNEKNIAQNFYKKLLRAETPVLAILRKGEIHFDVLTIFDEDIPLIAKMVKSVL